MAQKFLHILLFPLSLIYRIIIEVRYWCYRSGIIPIRSLSAPVICFGNITAGGTGKTPAVIAAAQWYVAQGIMPVILTRGYKNAAHRTLRKYNNMLPIGDEASYITTVIPHIHVVVDHNRYRAGTYAVETYKPRIILMDDGFQHLSLKRDMDIILIDCINPFDNGCLLPSGLLREPKKALQRAHMIVLTKTNLISDENKQSIINEIRDICGDRMLILESIHKPTRFFSLYQHEEYDLSWIAGKKIITVMGIGNPEAFMHTMESLHADIQHHYIYPDHHMFSQHEMNDIIHHARATQSVIVTTAKDGIRIQYMSLPQSTIFILEIKLVITKGEEIWKKKLIELAIRG